MSTVRRAIPADLETIVQMGRALHKESPRYRGMIFDAEKVRELVAGLIQSPTAAVFIVEAEGEPTGLAAIVAAERWFGPNRYATDLAVYVKPEHRGNGAFVRLVQAIE